MMVWTEGCRRCVRLQPYFNFEQLRHVRRTDILAPLTIGLVRGGQGHLHPWHQTRERDRCLHTPVAVRCAPGCRRNSGFQALSWAAQLGAGQPLALGQTAQPLRQMR